MTAYYNENDAQMAAWLRELIKSGLIAHGEVDTRSIVDVSHGDLRGFTQCHFFAGIGGWSYALRLAGWPDDRPVWTASCPCQPFSTAGKRKGKSDERHLWPEFYRLVKECRPHTAFGEQVAAAIGLDWLDHVQDDLEAIGYACGAVVLPACSVGAPHIRQRLWFVADSRSSASERNSRGVSGEKSQSDQERELDGCMPIGHKHGGAASELADSICQQEHEKQQRPEEDEGIRGPDEPSGRSLVGASGQLADSNEGGRNRKGVYIQRREPRQTSFVPSGDGELGALVNARQLREGRNEAKARQVATGGVFAEASTFGELGNTDDTRPQGRWERRNSANQRTPWQTGVDGFWSSAEWLPCRDGKARPTKSGLFPLAYGIPGRVGLLRGAGNSIVPQVAAEVIKAYMSIEDAK